MVREDGFLAGLGPCHICHHACVERGLPRLTFLQAGLKASGSYVEARAVSELDETLDAEVQKRKGDGQMTRRAREAQG